MMLKKFILICLVLFVLPSALAIAPSDIFKNLHNVNADFGFGTLEFDVCNPTVQNYQVTGDTFQHLKNEVKGSFTGFELYYNNSGSWQRLTHLPTVQANTCYNMFLKVFYDMDINENGSASVSVDWIPKIKLGVQEFVMNEWAWFNNSWQYRQRFNYSSMVASTLNDYELHLEMDTQTLIGAGKMQADGDDIRITNASGSDLLSIGNFIEINDTDTVIPFKADELINNTANTSFFYIYYGNPTASSGVNTSGMWSEYAGVIDYEDNRANTTVDCELGDDCDLTASANTDTVYNTSGISGGCFQSDSTDSAETTNTTFLDRVTEAINGTGQVQIWFKSNDADWSTDSIQIFYKMWGTDNDNRLENWYWSNDDLTRFNAEFNDVTNQITDGTIKDDTDWHMFTGSLDVGTTTNEYWIDGVSKGTDATVPRMSVALTKLWTTDADDSNFGANGCVDNFRIHNGSRTDDEIKMDYYQYTNVLYSFGSEEVVVLTTALTMTNITTTDFNFATPNYVTGVDFDFNTSSTTNLTFLTSFNVEKSTGSGDSVIGARFKVDGVTIKEENITTVSSIGDVKSTGLSLNLFELSTGQHNITVEFKRTGNGQITVDNIDLGLVELLSGEGNTFTGDLLSLNYSHANTDFEQSPNLSVVKGVASETYYLSHFSLTANASDYGTYALSEVGENSSFMRRFISSATSIGSAIISWIEDSEEAVTHNMSVLSKTDTGNNISSNISVLHFDMNDSAGLFLTHFHTTNVSTNATANTTLTAGTYTLVSETINIVSGNSSLINAYVSLGSDSGTQTPSINITSNATACSSTKERYFSGSDDYGTVYINLVCNGLSTETYQVNLTLTVEAGETVEVYDEVLSALDGVTLDITTGNLAPIPNEITNPIDQNRSVPNATLDVTWNAFTDPNGDTVTYNVSLNNSDGSFNQTIVGATLTLSQSFNFATLDNNTAYLINVLGCDGTACSSSSSNFSMLYTITPAVTVSTDTDVTFLRVGLPEIDSSLIWILILIGLLILVALILRS